MPRNDRLHLEVLEDRRLLAIQMELLKDIFPGPDSSIPVASPTVPVDFTNVDGVLFFPANDGEHGLELWKSDGTAGGTELVKDNHVGSANGGGLRSVNVGGTLFFAGADAATGLELWKSDGTAAGTVLVKDIAPGPNLVGSKPQYFTNVGGTLFFFAEDQLGDSELWKSDGTEIGTVRVKDIRPGHGSSMQIGNTELVEVGTTLFFNPNDGTNGAELWQSDGTEEGTVLVKDIWPGPDESHPEGLVNVNGVLFFTAASGSGSRELWKSDGTEQGTVLVTSEIVPGAGSLMNVGGTLFFTAADATHGWELWKSDGTEQGTVLVRDIALGATNSNPAAFENVEGTLYFAANDGTSGHELWRSDGTEAGTVRVKDINPGAATSLLSNFTSVGTTLFFRATDGFSGIRLWQSDGTESGTVLVEDFTATPISEFAVRDRLFVVATDDQHGRELWTGRIGPTGDFNSDGVYDCLDINALVAAIVDGVHDPLLDLTGDGLVDLADRDAWLNIAGGVNLGPGQVYPVGDANLDGSVNDGDFALWNRNKFTMVTEWCRGDFNADGAVDGSDFNLWNANKYLSSESRGKTSNVPAVANRSLAGAGIASPREAHSDRKDTALPIAVALPATARRDLPTPSLRDVGAWKQSIHRPFQRLVRTDDEVTHIDGADLTKVDGVAAWKSADRI